MHFFFFKHNKIKFQKHKYVSHINYKKETKKHTNNMYYIYTLFFIIQQRYTP